MYPLATPILLQHGKSWASSIGRLHFRITRVLEMGQLSNHQRLLPLTSRVAGQILSRTYLPNLAVLTRQPFQGRIIKKWALKSPGNCLNLLNWPRSPFARWSLFFENNLQLAKWLRLIRTEISFGDGLHPRKGKHFHDLEFFIPVHRYFQARWSLRPGRFVDRCAVQKATYIQEINHLHRTLGLGSSL